MNYRHIYHAGNFADCFKHALLVWLIGALQRKPGAIVVLDTHAGTGRYDLDAEPATRTGEWRQGIARLLDDPPQPLAGYVALVRALGLYPGSPALARRMLRAQDRLACCELHPEDHAVLRRHFAGDPQVSVHRRNAWEALSALLPPPERRGVVLIDPPYEVPAEFDRVAAGLRRGHARFPTGVFAAWYPVKHRAPVRAFHTAMRDSGMRHIVAVELLLRAPFDPARLNGCGLLVVNPPYRFEQEAPAILAALLERLGTREDGEGVDLVRLAEE
ncbi:MAG: 23S rRNA (adenine(2030)-N(6))-methyltransferase RlmJ [Rhodospirillales bacterium]|nr:23S rRNA (adenine(2030)-N(6))-methyltransferase RlmJ [Rhodospirillales bacterium]